MSLSFLVKHHWGTQAAVFKAPHWGLMLKTPFAFYSITLRISFLNTTFPDSVHEATIKLVKCIYSLVCIISPILWEASFQSFLKKFYLKDKKRQIRETKKYSIPWFTAQMGYGFHE